jgi:hypothetical protein
MCWNSDRRAFAGIVTGTVTGDPVLEQETLFGNSDGRACARKVTENPVLEQGQESLC